MASIEQGLDSNETLDQKQSSGPRVDMRRRSYDQTDENGWNNRWNVADSKGNGQYHPFYKQYFDKDQKKTDGNFVFSYAQTSSDKLPGILDNRNKVRYDDQPMSLPGKDALDLHCTTRYPVTHIQHVKVQADIEGHKVVHPLPSQHNILSNNYRNDSITVSHHNNVHHVSQREYFDRPVEVPRKGYSHMRKNHSKQVPFAVYAGKTPQKKAKQHYMVLSMQGSQSQFDQSMMQAASKSPSPKAAGADPDFVGVFANSQRCIPSLREKYQATVEYDKILERRKNSSYLENKNRNAKTTIKLKPLQQFSTISPHFSTTHSAYQQHQ